MDDGDDFLWPRWNNGPGLPSCLKQFKRKEKQVCLCVRVYETMFSRH